MCEKLVVGVSTDEVVESYKSKRPVVPYQQRAEIVRAIRYVDEVVPQTSMDKLEMWKQIRYDVMFHGDEWKGSELYKKYERELATVGAEIVYLPHTPGVSSTELREKRNL